MGSPTGIVFGRRRPSLGFTPENVLNTGFTPGLDDAPTAADLYARHTTSDHMPAYADQRLELQRARLVESLISQQHRARTETRQRLAGAALAESLGELEPTDPQFDVKMSKLFTQFPEGADSAAVKVVAGIKRSAFNALTKAQTEHRQAVYNATLSKRIDPLLSSDQVPFDLKNQLINEDGTFNVNALEQAEALHSNNGGKNGAQFYSNLTKTHGLTKDDLEYVIANPDAVRYRDSSGGQVAADAVNGEENKFRAVGVLPNNGALNLPLNTFNALVTTHKNLARQQAPGAVGTTQTQEQAFRDRETMEATLKTQGLTPVSAAPPGYDTWKATKTPAASKTAADELTRLLGKSPSPTPTPSVAITPQQAAGNVPADAEFEDDLGLNDE